MKIFGRKKQHVPSQIILRSRGSAADMVAELDASLTVWPWERDCAGNPMKIATVYRCVRLISESVAQLPLYHYKRNAAGVFERERGTWLSYLLEQQPMEIMSRYDYWKQAVQQLLCTGNAHIVKMRNTYSGAIDRLVLCSPYSCSYDAQKRTYKVSDAVRGLYDEYPAEDVIHLKGLSNDGETGLSVLEFARLTTQIAESGDKETRERFRNGGNVRGFFTNAAPGVTGYNPFNDKTLKEASQTNDRFFRAGGRLSYLPGGMQFKELMLTSADMQFLESRKFTVREICRFFGVHPSFVFDDTSNNYKSAEMANVAFLSNTLNPILVQIEQEMTRKLLTPEETRVEKFEFDRTHLFACDLETRVKWQTARIGAGLDTLNEARFMDNRGPVEGGDTVLVSANLRPLSEMMNGETTNQKKEDQ